MISSTSKFDANKLKKKKILVVPPIQTWYNFWRVGKPSSIFIQQTDYLQLKRVTIFGKDCSRHWRQKNNYPILSFKQLTVWTPIGERKKKRKQKQMLYSATSDIIVILQNIAVTKKVDRRKLMEGKNGFKDLTLRGQMRIFSRLRWNIMWEESTV